MKLICPLSGIAHNSSHFSLSKVNCTHPIFMLSLTELDIIVSQWKARLLKSDETKLLTIALLYSTDLITITEPLNKLRIDTCESELINIYELLLFIKSNSRNLDYWNKSLEYEGFSHKVFMTANLSNSNINNLQSLIKEWENNKLDYIDNYKATKAKSIRASQSESAKQALRKIHTKPNIAGKRLALWAMASTNFPKVGIGRNGKKIALSDYWCFIIEACATRNNNNDLFGKVYKDDIKLLLDYLLDTSNVFVNRNPLDLNNPLSYTLIKLLKDSMNDMEFISIDNYELIRDIAGKRLALWAMASTNFPKVGIGRNGKKIALSDYWCFIIESCATRNNNNDLDIPDLPSDIVNKEEPLLTRPIEKDYPTKVKYNIALANYSSQQNRLRGII